jgi:hypothetical protein
MMATHPCSRRRVGHAWLPPDARPRRCRVPCPLLARWEGRATLRRFSTSPRARSHSPSLLSARLRLLFARNDSHGHRMFPSLPPSSSSPVALSAPPSDGTCGHRDPLRPVLAQRGAPSTTGATRRRAAAVAPAGARGQADLARFRPSQGASRVRKGLYVLHRHRSPPGSHLTGRPATPSSISSVMIRDQGPRAQIRRNGRT